MSPRRDPSLRRRRSRSIDVHPQLIHFRCAIVVLAIAWSTASAQTAASETAALIDLFSNTSGSKWVNSAGWVNGWGSDPCTNSWFGLTCSGSTPNHVVYVVWLEGGPR